MDAQKFRPVRELWTSGVKGNFIIETKLPNGFAPDLEVLEKKKKRQKKKGYISTGVFSFFSPYDSVGGSIETSPFGGLGRTKGLS